MQVVAVSALVQQLVLRVQLAQYQQSLRAVRSPVLRLHGWHLLALQAVQAELLQAGLAHQSHGVGQVLASAAEQVVVGQHRQILSVATLRALAGSPQFQAVLLEQMMVVRDMRLGLL